MKNIAEQNSYFPNKNSDLKLIAVGSSIQLGANVTSLLNLWK